MSDGGSLTSGRTEVTSFSGLPVASSAVRAFGRLPFDALVSRERRHRPVTLSLFPDLISYFSVPKKRIGTEDLNAKKKTKDFYKLDDNFIELIDPGPTWVDGRAVVSDPFDLHVCPECKKQYSTSSNLARHRQTHRHGNGGSGSAGTGGDRKARKCPHCDKEYVSMPAFSMHVRTHNEGCACPHCGKRFSRPWLLQGHVRTHTGEKPFRCPECAKTFADKSNLRAHIQTHSTEKPFVCGRCSKAFALKSYLYKHEESSCMRTPRLFEALHQQQH